MARVSFTLRSSQGGSALQRDPSLLVDDDSALRGEAFGGNVPVPPPPSAPSVPVFGATSSFSATPIDYGVVQLQWNIGTPLVSTVTTDAQPTEIVIRYSTVGEPMTPQEGSRVTTISPGREVFSLDHSNLPQGVWVYYSLFARYESTTLNPWYERVASLTVLVPRDYKSTDLLWSRIPEHYRIVDSAQAEGNFEVRSLDNTRAIPDELIEQGPLYRMLSAFGWEMDRTRTLAHYLMVQKDPDLATPEVLDALAYELGLDLTSQDLGTTRLRGILSDIGYLREFKGTVQGVREWLTALSGCDVVIRPIFTNSLTSAQSQYTGTITVTTNPEDVPSGNEWVIEGTGIAASLDPDRGLVISKTGASGYAVARTRISDIEQAQWYRSYIDITSRRSAQVLGVSLSASVNPVSSLIVEDGVVQEPYPTGFAYTPSFGSDNWYQMPTSLGIVGDGTLSTVPMYFSVFMIFNEADSSLVLNNAVLQKDSLFPYKIDIYSQRANLVRDPQFVYGTNQEESYWHVFGGTTVYDSSGSIGASSSTDASISFCSRPIDPATILLKNAELWLSAEGFEEGAGQENGTPFLQGIPYYFSCEDIYGTLKTVSIYSEKYGLIATASEPTERQVGSSISTVRKYWSLSREYVSPWLPLELTDCFIEITGYGTNVGMRKPLLEAYKYDGDYFDGDNVDGGWLQAESVAGSVRDYRWGDAGQHQSFSYYTSDFQRTRNTIDRLLPSLIPVTQTVTLTDDNYNRIYGYTGNGLP